MNIGDKRAQICAMGFIPVAASVVKKYAGCGNDSGFRRMDADSGLFPGVQGKERCRGIDGAGAESGGY